MIVATAPLVIKGYTFAMMPVRGDYFLPAEFTVTFDFTGKSVY
jgi:hypothetical protein